MGLGRFLIRAGLASVAGTAAYLVATKQSPLDWGRNLATTATLKRQQVETVVTAKKRLDQRVQQLTNAIDEAAPTMTAISNDVDKFMFKAQPHLDKINEVSDRLNQLV